MSVGAYPSSTEGREARRLGTLYRLLAELTRAKGLEDIYEAAIRSVFAATSADRAAILTFDHDGVMRFRTWRHLSAEFREAVTGHTPWRQGAHGAQAVVADVVREENLEAYRDAFADEGIRAAMFLPLALEAGVFGNLALYSSEAHDWDDDEVAVAQAIAGHVALAAEHKRAELALARNERRLQTIIDNSPTVIFLKDAEGRYLLVNRRFEELFHVNRAAIVGKTDYDIFPRETADHFRENDRKVLAADEPLAVEEYAPHDGVLRTYISIKFPMEGADGTVAGVCGIATDITERKQLEAASRYLAAVVEGSADAIVSKDLNGIITSWNKGAERIFGYTADEAIGQPVAMLAAPDRHNEMPEILNKVRSGQRVEHYETIRRRKDGQAIYVSLTVSPILDASGKIIGASKIARDITDRKLAEQERTLLLSRERDARKTAELLNRIGPRLAAERDPASLLQVVLEIAVALVGAEYGWFFQVANEAGEPSVLYTLAGDRLEAFESVAMPHGVGLLAPMFRGGGVVRSDDLTQDPRYVSDAPGLQAPEDGLTLSNSLTKDQAGIRSFLAAPVISRSGEALGGLAFGHSDSAQFTDNHEAILTGLAAHAAIAMDNARLFEQAQWVQDELKRSNEELRRANDDLETFAYSASHDLQEPIRTISLSAQLVERTWGDRLPGDAAKFLTSISQGALRMEHLLKDLLAYTTATKYAEGPPPVVDSGMVLANVLENLRSRIEQAGATVTHGPMPVISVHESRLIQLLQNLIGNALKYRRREAAPRVHISAEERDGWFVFSVTDNGIGIDPHYADRIFGLFKRLHNHDQYPGSGIGLAICQRIVRQYGGRIWLEKSAPGEGSTFCFSIPAGTRQR